MNDGINLLNPEKRGAPAAFMKQLWTARLVTVGLLFIVSVSSVILFMLVSLSPLPSLQKQEQSLQATLAQSKTDILKVALVNERIGTINTILSQRQSYDQAFSAIENQLTGDLTVTTIQADKKNMVLTVTSLSLTPLNAFLNGLIGDVQNKKVFSQITLLNLTNDAQTSGYTATVQLSLL